MINRAERWEAIVDKLSMEFPRHRSLENSNSKSAKD